MAYTFTTLNDPLAVGGTFVGGINDSGQIVGYYSAADGSRHGFLYNGGTYTTVDHPPNKFGNAFTTTLRDINNSGVIVAHVSAFGDTYSSSSGIWTGDVPPGVGYLYPFSGDTAFTGISNLGQVVGTADRTASDTTPISFTGLGATIVNDPAAATGPGGGTFAEDINSSGVVIGYYLTANSKAKAFYEINGSYLEFSDLPANILNIYGYGINDSGQSVGYYVDNVGKIHGWIDNVNTPSFTTFDFPGATGGTFLQNINNLGQLVGYYSDATGIHGFVATFTAVQIVNQTTHAQSNSPGTPYSGPVAGLQYQYINITTDSLNVTALSPNGFIHTGSGFDAIDVSNVSGTNVLDGGTNSNFLVGGTAAGSFDTFFVDNRNPPGDIWSTVVNFHKGDDATVWGVTQAGFNLAFANGEGAAGFTGLTLHVTKSGVPTASLTLSGYTTADLSNGKLSTSFGNVGGADYFFVHGNG